MATKIQIEKEKTFNHKGIDVQETIKEIKTDNPAQKAYSLSWTRTPAMAAIIGDKKNPFFSKNFHLSKEQIKMCEDKNLPFDNVLEKLARRKVQESFDSWWGL